MTVLYVNGDSNSAGAELANDYAFAEDDPLYKEQGRAPHPDNIDLSYGAHLAKELKTPLLCDAESASSNDRIMRTTIDYLNSEPENPFVLIGWSSWEREEWNINGTMYQVTAGGKDILPSEYEHQYRGWVSSQTIPEIQRKSENWCDKIWNLHQQLQNENIKHLFFNCIEPFPTRKYDFGLNYFYPYDKEYTFYHYLKQYDEPNENFHFGLKSHKRWANLLLDRIKEIV